MNSSPAEQPSADDITDCDREPIHIPGAVQPQGVLLALQIPELTIAQASGSAAEHFGRDAESLLGEPLSSLFGREGETQVRACLELPPGMVSTPLPLTTRVADREQMFNGIVHRSGECLILECEPTEDVSGRAFLGLGQSLRVALAQMARATSARSLCETAAREVRQITGFDRVLVYRFDPEWNGAVVAEDRREDMASYLHHHFPASDIPRQARELYAQNLLRLVADVHARPVPLVPANNPNTGQPLDLTFSSLRSVSPIHIEYLKNMGVGASMSVSILHEGQLWGLIACHHDTANPVPYEARLACELLGQALSLRVAAIELRETLDGRAERGEILRHLLDSLPPEPSIWQSLVARETLLLSLVDAAGAAVFADGDCLCVGNAPSEADARRVWDRLRDTSQSDLFSTDSLAAFDRDAFEGLETARGALAIWTSAERRDGIVWFRPEMVRTIEWAGNPEKPVEREAGQARIHPRKSFETWRQTVRLKSAPWGAAEIEAARSLRHAILEAALRRAVDGLAQANSRLEEKNRELDSFAYITSHDLKAPLRGIANLSRWIEEDMGEALTDDVRGQMHLLRGRVHRMEAMIAGILQLSRVGREPINPVPVDVGSLLNEIIDLLAPPPGFTIEVARDMPIITTEPIRLQQVFQNLISNALKHHAKTTGRIEITARESKRFWEFAVADDGPGISPKYHARIFELFQTLEARDKTENTGLGLALVKKIVEGQGGAIQVESEEGQGTTFRFTWPKRRRETS